jgi:hypothetical protein
MPFPSTLDSFLAAGYSYLKWEKCSVCGLDVEIWTTPGRRTIAMEPTHSDSPVVRHYEQCNLAPKQESPKAPQQIKLYGVTDKNMIACGWLAGVLAVQFRYGRYHYANVAEDVFTKIWNNPFPNAIFVKLVKNHPELYPCTKLE